MQPVEKGMTAQTEKPVWPFAGTRLVLGFAQP